MKYTWSIIAIVSMLLFNIIRIKRFPSKSVYPLYAQIQYEYILTNQLIYGTLYIIFTRKIGISLYIIHTAYRLSKM